MDVPSVMRAAVLRGPNDLRLSTVPVPEPGHGEVLVRVRACAICGSDREVVGGHWPGSPPFGQFIPGHEFAGEVVALGDSVDEFSVGDRVAVEPTRGCGRCSNCLKGLYTACLNYGNASKGHKHVGFTVNGGYAEYAVQSVANVHRLPDHIGFRDATLITTAGTAVYGFERAGGIEVGETVVILGPGAVGLLALQFARAMGAGTTIAIGINDWSLELAGRLGADHTVHAGKTDPVQAVRELTGGLGAGLAVECSGSSKAAEIAPLLLGKSGRAVFLGFPEKPVTIDVKRLALDNITLAGSRAEGMRSCERAMALFARGVICTEPLVTHVFPLERITEAMELYFSKADGVVKVVIEP